MAEFPHCDSLVLHAPGVCVYCDMHPEAQQDRILHNIAFTGEPPSAEVYADPATQRRPLEVIERWYGNQPKGKTEVEELVESAKRASRPKVVTPRQMHTFDYVIHRVFRDTTGVVCVCCNCFEVRYLYGPNHETDYEVLNASDGEPCPDGAVYLNRGRRLEAP